MSRSVSPVDMAQALAWFEQSLDLPRDQRRDWLAEQCDQHEETLRHMDLWLAQEATEGDMSLEIDPITLPELDRQGQRVGPWELMEPIGSGGMSTVHRARRVDGSFEQEVAIKLFQNTWLNDTALLRFQNERQILANLDHPNIARLIDGGTTEDGTPYVALELVDGEPITQYCQHHRLSVEARIELIMAVCDGLEAAHRQGIIHRDIKPSNILINSNGQAKLIDFGIAKQLGQASHSLDLPQTRAGEVFLTPEYASPEQVLGQAVSEATDVHALGLILYEILTGYRPHRLDNFSAREMERAICDSIPETPSALVRKNRDHLEAWVGSPRTLIQALRGDVDKIIMTCLKKSAKERYRSVNILRDDLERHLGGEPVIARGTSRGYRLRKFIARHPTTSAALGLTLAILLAAVWIVNQQAREATRQARQAEATTQFLLQMIGRSDPFVEAQSMTLIDALKNAIPSISTRFDGQPVLEAQMRFAIGYALQNLGETEQSRQQFEQSLRLREAFSDAVDQAESIQGIGIVDWWDSRYADGVSRFETALGLLEGDDSDRASVLRINTLANLAAMLTEMQEHARSRDLSIRAIGLAAGRSDIDDETRANLWGNLATAEESLGHFKAAENAFDQTLKLLKRSVGDTHPTVAIALNNYAFLFFSQGELDRAIELFGESVALRRSTLGNDHPQVANALSNLAGALLAAGRNDQAIGPAHEALGIARRGFEPGHWRIGKSLQMLARIYQQSGVTEQARDYARQALDILGEAEGDHRNAIEELNAILTP